MPDIFLRPGAGKPGDIILRDPAHMDYGGGYAGTAEGIQRKASSSASGILSFTGTASGTQKAQTSAGDGRSALVIVIPPVISGGGGGGGLPAWSSEWANPKPRRRRKIVGRGRATCQRQYCTALGIVTIGGWGGGKGKPSFASANGDNDSRRRKDERDLIEFLMMNVA
jgi:hypothetical protein